MMAKVCERCDREMKFVPAGFSRTKNKAYTAFWACDSRNGGCGATQDATAGEGVGSAAPSSGQLDRIESKLDQLLAFMQPV